MIKSNLLKMKKDNDRYKFNYNLSELLWFRNGGNADVFFNAPDLVSLVEFLASENSGILDVFVLGNGSNVLVRNLGFRGIVIKLGSFFNHMNKIDDEQIFVSCATKSLTLANFAAKNSISGMEFLSTIPGTIGGNIFMNAGCFGSDIESIFVQCTCVDYSGKIHVFKKEDIVFDYRKTSIKNMIIVDAIFKGKKSKESDILAKMAKMKEERKKTQPIAVKTCGSTFKNPPGDKKAWEYIQGAGLQNLRVGGVMFSEKHANFMINYDNGTASEAEALGELTRAIVKEKYSIELEWEIQRVGSFW